MKRPTQTNWADTRAVLNALADYRRGVKKSFIARALFSDKSDSAALNHAERCLQNLHYTGDARYDADTDLWYPTLAAVDLGYRQVLAHFSTIQQQIDEYKTMMSGQERN